MDICWPAEKLKQGFQVCLGSHRWLPVHVGQHLPLNLQEWLLLLEIKRHICLVLVIHMQLRENGLHHAPVEAALCHVLHEHKEWSVLQQPQSDKAFAFDEEAGKEHLKQAQQLHDHVQHAEVVRQQMQPNSATPSSLFN